MKFYKPHLPSTRARVPSHTSPKDNARIRQAAVERIIHLSHASPEEIERRLEELDREWDIERALEANAATVALSGCILGMAKHRAWFLVPTAVSAFLLQHALQGWCPPLGLLRRMGFRTSDEINQERWGLKALRGDLGQPVERPEEVVDAIFRSEN